MIDSGWKNFVKLLITAVFLVKFISRLLFYEIFAIFLNGRNLLTILKNPIFYLQVMRSFGSSISSVQRNPDFVPPLP